MSGRNKSSGRDVNLKVDKCVSLRDIIPPSENPGARRVCALKIDGKSPLLQDLDTLRIKKEREYKKLFKVINLVAQNNEVFGRHVKRGKGVYKDIYEMRSSHVRLFFFYTPTQNEIVICTNLYWKAKDSHEEQEQAFRTCLAFRNLYFSYYHQENT